MCGELTVDHNGEKTVIKWLQSWQPTCDYLVKHLHKQQQQQQTTNKSIITTNYYNNYVYTYICIHKHLNLLINSGSQYTSILYRPRNSAHQEEKVGMGTSEPRDIWQLHLQYKRLVEPYSKVSLSTQE